MKGPQAGQYSQVVRREQQRMAVVGDIMARLGIKEDTPEDTETIEARNDVESLVSDIRGYSEQLAACYGGYLPEKSEALALAMHDTITDLTNRLSERVRGPHDDQMINGLNELLLLVQVDSLFSQGDHERIDILQVTPGREPVVTANIKGLELIIQDGQNVQRFVPYSATWMFEANGIRMQVFSKDTVSGELHIIESGMDCHHRPAKARRLGVDSRAATESALDVHGEYLNPALRRLGRDGDYHRSEFLDPVVSKDDFQTISRNRLSEVVEMYSN